MDELWTVVHTSEGPARVRLVDRWIAVARGGELLERDVWEVSFEHAGVQVIRRMRTLPEPPPRALLRAVEDVVRVGSDTTPG